MKLTYTHIRISAQHPKVPSVPTDCELCCSDGGVGGGVCVPAESIGGDSVALGEFDHGQLGELGARDRNPYTRIAQGATCEPLDEHDHSGDVAQHFRPGDLPDYHHIDAPVRGVQMVGRGAGQRS